MSYRLTVLTVESNTKVVTEHATLTNARKAFNSLVNSAFEKDTAVKIRDANKALIAYELVEGHSQSPAVPVVSGKWYVRTMNITRGKFAGKRFASEAEATAYALAQVNASEDNSYDTAVIVRRPDDSLLSYQVIWGNGDQLETRPPNSAN